MPTDKDVIDLINKLKEDLSSQQNTKLPNKEFKDFSRILYDLKSVGAPLSNEFSNAARQVGNFQKLFSDLSQQGFKKFGVAAGALAGPMGIAATAAMTLASGIMEFTKMMAQARMEVAVLSVQMGTAGNVGEKLKQTFQLASELAGKYSMKVGDVTKIMSAITMAGIKIDDADPALKNIIKDFTELQIGLGVTADVTQSTLKLFRQEYNIKDELLNRTLALVKASQSLNMTHSDYLRLVVNLTRGFITFGIGAMQTAHELEKAATTLGLGAERAQAYTKEMIAGPRQAGLGQRAWLAQQMGIGGGNTLAGAAMLGYGQQTPTNLGITVIQQAIRSMGLGMEFKEGQRLRGTEEEWGQAAQIAMFAKQFGIEERTVYESLGLPVKKQVDIMGDIGKDVKGIREIMTKNLKDISESRWWLQQIRSFIDKEFYGFLGKSGAEQRKILGNIISTIGGPMTQGIAEIGKLGYEKFKSTTTKERKHGGGIIGDTPRYHNGISEIDATLLSGESVLNRNATRNLGKENIDRLNSGGVAGSTNINISVNIPVLKQYIESAITSCLRDNPQLIQFG